MTARGEFDYVIIGAGSAGCVLAARLSQDPGVSVALVEAGGRDDAAGRDRLYGEAQRILADDAVNGFLFLLPKLAAWNKDIVGLWENSPIQATDLTKVSWR